MPSSSWRRTNHVISNVATTKALYSTSGENQDMMDCFFWFQLVQVPNHPCIECLGGAVMGLQRRTSVRYKCVAIGKAWEDLIITYECTKEALIGARSRQGTKESVACPSHLKNSGRKSTDLHARSSTWLAHSSGVVEVYCACFWSSIKARALKPFGLGFFLICYRAI